MSNCEMKSYLNHITNDKSVIEMLKLRTGNHSLSVEADIYRNRKVHNERICNLCDTQSLQDLHLVITECPKFLALRSKALFFVSLQQS